MRPTRDATLWPASDPVAEARLPHLGIARAVDFIGRNYHHSIHLKDVAAQACLSKYHFSRVFHRIVGVPYHSYLTMIRVAEARELLEKALYRSVTEIGYAVGFEGLRNFEARFKRLVGVTPSEYRAITRSEARLKELFGVRFGRDSTSE